MTHAPVASHSLPISHGEWKLDLPYQEHPRQPSKASMSSLVKPALLPIQVLSECKAPISDSLLYLRVPCRLLKGSDTTLHLTWTSGQGLDRAMRRSQQADPHSHGQ